MISEAVGVVQTTVETQEDVDPALSNTLHTGETKQTVAVADFAGTVTKHPSNGIYKAYNAFACTGDVFIEKMTLSDPNDKLQPPQTAETAGSVVTVEGFTILEYIDTDPDADSANNFERIIERDFDNRFLRAGDSIMVKGETDQSSTDCSFGFSCRYRCKPTIIY